MRSTQTAFQVLVVAGMSMVLASCTGSVSRRPAPPPHRHAEVVVVEHHGPPPHAPAHGYRHKHRNVVLIYEASLGVYTVDKRSDCYFYGSYFYRVKNGGWQVSVEMNGPWRNVPDYRLPEKLRHHEYVKASKKHKNKPKKNKRR